MDFQKEMVIEKIKKDESFLQIEKENNLSIDEIQNNLLTLYSYLLKKEHCSNCLNCSDCPQHYLMKEPVLVYNGRFDIEYVECPLYKKEIKETEYLNNLITIEYDLSNVNDEELFRTKPARKQLFQKMKEIYINKSKNIACKGLYLYGNYGVGKSYICGCFAKIYAKLGLQTVYAFYPELVRVIKSAISSGQVEDYIDLIKKADVLFLDDFGGDVQTSWIRDEVLFPILQYRMEHQLLTFMTSNLDQACLHDHLAETKEASDENKACRIEERIKALMEFIELKDNNYRL